MQRARYQGGRIRNQLEVISANYPYGQQTSKDIKPNRRRSSIISEYLRRINFLDHRYKPYRLLALILFIFIFIMILQV